MPQQGINFQGFFIGLPGAYYQDDVTAALSTSPPLTPPMVVVGYGFGPKPKTPVTFTNPNDFLNAVRGGPVSGFIPFMANPSPVLNGAQLFTFIDVSSNTQSSLALTASGGGTAATLTSTQYGPPSNLLTGQVSAGSIAGVKLTLNDTFSGVDLVGDNLGAPFQVAYVGTATGGITYGTVGTSGAITAFDLIVSGRTQETFAIPLGASGYSTVSQLVAAINGTGFFVADLVSSTQGELPANQISVQAGAIASGGAFTFIFAYAFDLPFWVNQFAGAEATAAIGASNVDTSGWIPINVGPIFFTGAIGVPPTTSSYASGLGVALTVPGWTVFCDSSATAVQALLAQHCKTASTPPYGMWRRGWTGSTLGDQVATTLTNAVALDAKETSYCYPGIVATNTLTGVSGVYSGLTVAAMSASMAAGNNVNIPLTHKTLAGVGVEQISGLALTQSQIVQLQNSGVQVTYLEQSNNLPTILSDITTWQVDNNLENTSSQQVACRFWLAYSVVNTLKNYVGTVASTVDEVVILKALIRTLNALLRASPTDNGVLSSWDTSSLKLVFTGSNMVAAITFNATLVGQNRFITCFVPIQELNLTVTVANVSGQ